MIALARNTLSRLEDGGGPTFRRYSPYLGATVSSVDLGAPLAQETEVELRQALLDHGVLFFRDQALSPGRLREVIRIFGTLREPPTWPWSAGVTALYAPDGCARQFETWWTSSTGAYRLLDPLLGDYLETLRAVAIADTAAEGPLIDIHPRTGEKFLCISELHTAYLKDVSRSTSDRLLRLLLGALETPALHARFAWRPRSFVIWDNRLVQRRDSSFADDARGLLHASAA